MRKEVLYVKENKRGKQEAYCKLEEGKKGGMENKALTNFTMDKKEINKPSYERLSVNFAYIMVDLVGHIHYLKKVVRMVDQPKTIQVLEFFLK